MTRKSNKMTIQLTDIPEVNVNHGNYMAKGTKDAIGHILQYGGPPHHASTTVGSIESMISAIEAEGLKVKDVLASDYAKAVLGHGVNVLRSSILRVKLDELESFRHTERRRKREEDLRKFKQEQEAKQRADAESKRTGLNAEERELLKKLLAKEREAQLAVATDTANSEEMGPEYTIDATDIEVDETEVEVVVQVEA